MGCLRKPPGVELIPGVWGRGEDWGQGDGLPRPQATSWKGHRQCLGGGGGLGSGEWAAPPPRHKGEGGGIRAGGKVAPWPHVTWIWGD
jgi:hypothetical protein